MEDQAMMSKALYGAYRRGYKDRVKAGSDCIDNPYKDVRSVLGHVTFSLAYRKAWQDWMIDASFNKPCKMREET
jgi:hypothetical protein